MHHSVTLFSVVTICTTLSLYSQWLLYAPLFHFILSGYCMHHSLTLFSVVTICTTLSLYSQWLLYASLCHCVIVFASRAVLTNTAVVSLNVAYPLVSVIESRCFLSTVKRLHIASINCLLQINKMQGVTVGTGLVWCRDVWCWRTA